MRRSLVRKVIKGNDYWYWQSRCDGKTVQKYLGRGDDPAVERVRERIAQRTRGERLCATLQPLFGPALQEPMARVLAALQAA
ncbi:MAG: hypothetical protein FJ100_19330 [Deltaproteobacteria bacterium]|nr:hypothetical protein [Deltaproteobacteria bacterium]